MGQYYIAVFLADKTPDQKEEIIRAYVDSWHYNEGSKLIEHSYLDSNFINTVEFHLSKNGMFYKTRVCWAGDYADPELNSSNSSNLYRMSHAYESKILYISSKSSVDLPYIINHSKKQFVDKRKLRSFHPLPLLTAEGNGRGGGDYRGDYMNQIGIWARDVISVEKDITEGFEELICNFEESFKLPI
jgi:hypothetical protein